MTTTSEECICEHTDSFCPAHNGTGCETGEIIRHGSFGPIVWDRETGETRCATQHDMDTLDVGDDLTDEEEASISE